MTAISSICRCSSATKSGYEDCNEDCGIAAEYFNNVGSYGTWDMAITYDISEAISITGHVRNLFDREPNFSNGPTFACGDCNLRFNDPIGRTFGVTIRGKLGRIGDLADGIF